MKLKNFLFLALVVFALAGAGIYFKPRLETQKPTAAGADTGSAPKNIRETLTLVKESRAEEQLGTSEDPQGKFNLTLIKHVKDGLTTYTFHVINLETKADRVLYEEQAKPDITFDTPHNSWSPDNKELFVQVNVSGNANYYVFNADGSPFKDGQPFLNIGSYWEQSGKSQKFTVTGWAGKDLVQVMVIKDDGTVAASYWFVVSSHKFMQLAH